MRVLVVNAGSSSLKLSLLDDDRLLTASTVPVTDHVDVSAVVAPGEHVDAVGHRVVHGGTEFTGATRVDERVRARLEALTDLAPLHQPKSLAALDAVTCALPGAPAVACFDTAFHATIPPPAATYALPVEWRQRWPLRRFGFHGLSHRYASRRAAELVGQPTAQLRIVSCHLGAGASVTAVRGGVSVDTTMGFTPLEGLVMATRSGTVDPGLLLWLEEHVGMPPAELAVTLEQRSGLLGLAGTADMKAVLDAEAAGDARAELAVGVYLHRLRAAIASMAASLGGLDVLVFTGGVGERAARIRARVGSDLAFLGVQLDSDRNDAATSDDDISATRAGARTVVVTAREDLEIAAEVRRLLTS